MIKHHWQQCNCADIAPSLCGKLWQMDIGKLQR